MFAIAGALSLLTLNARSAALARSMKSCAASDAIRELRETDSAMVAGQATHLGEFSIEAPHRVNLATQPPEATGAFRLTAANGDTLTATFTGRGTPTATEGVFSVVETATITGGTGRFAGATGSFVVERSVELRPNALFEGLVRWRDQVLTNALHSPRSIAVADSDASGAYTRANGRTC